MRKSISLFAGILMTLGSFSQQIFTDFQDASMVIGQPDFTSQLMNYSDIVTYEPASIAISSLGMLAVAERTGGSVKIWYELPDTDGMPADVEVGNPDFNTYNPGPSQTFSNGFTGVAWSPDGQKLIASCGTQNRVLIWNSVPTSNGQAADVVLGQEDFTSTGASTKSNRLDNPGGILVAPDGRLLVADMNNNRVLIWNSIPIGNGEDADVVIGQDGFNSSTQGTGANNLYHPHGLHLTSKGQLLVANEWSHGIYVYDSIPVTDGESATIVIGHDDFGDGTFGTSITTMNMPFDAITTYDGKLAVVEYWNNRVTVFNSMPGASGAAADIVLGQQNFNSNLNFAPTGSAASNNFSQVSGVASDLNGRLFVSGISMNRVMVFGKEPAQSADLELSFKQSNLVLCENSDVVFKVNIHNSGPDTAYNVLATTALPMGYTFENSKADKGSYSKRSQHWKIPSLAPGEDAVLIIDAYVNSKTKTTTITSYANIIGSSAKDDNYKNNATSITVTIQSDKIPADPIVTDAQVCEGDMAMLFADGSGTIEWYTEDDCFTPVSEGSTYFTAPLSVNTTFFAKTNDICPGSERVPVQVNVSPIYSSDETAVICSGSSYTFPDGFVQDNITTATSHISYLTTVRGCDSIINTSISVLPAYSFDEDVTICSGDSYTFPDGTTLTNITSPTVHVSSFLTVDNCDSVITTTVNVNSSYFTTELVTLCSGNSYTFHDGVTLDDITISQIYASNFVTIDGCDSIIETEIVVLAVYNLTESVTICEGNSYTFPDGTSVDDIISSVVHTSNLVTSDGCDSIITTTVIPTSAYDISQTDQVCNGDSYRFPDGTVIDNIVAPVNHTSLLVSTGGCDSLVTINVTVNTIDVSVAQEGNLLTANLSSADYQWVDCDKGYNSVEGETGQIFEPMASGNYAVIITEGGCSSVSTCFNITLSGIEGKVTDNEIRVFPNPAKDQLTIHLPENSDFVKLSVINLQGQIVIEQNIEDFENTIYLDILDLKSGIYLLQLSSENDMILRKIIKE